MGLTRRQLLASSLGLAISGVALDVLRGVPAAAHEHSDEGSEADHVLSSALPRGRWSDPATWGGRVPAAGADVIVDRPILLDVDARVGRLTIPSGGALVFDPKSSRELVASGNVLVMGRLALRPDSPEVEHGLVFRGIDESRFVGGGLDPLDTDVGVWVMDAGTLDVAGTPKRAWIRARGAVAAGAATVELADSPDGWRVGDEIALTPTRHPSVDAEVHRYDVTTVAGIDGRTISLEQPTTVEHPAVAIGTRTTMTTEVLNLSRNVRIEGAPDGRAHVFIRSSSPQHVSHTQLRHLGPRQGRGRRAEFVSGRYGLHFHHCMDGSRGSIVEGVVARDLGNRSFVPHMSNGTTWRDCIAHDVVGTAYWWDPGDKTEETVYDSCVASRVSPGPDEYEVTGFFMGASKRALSNVARGCVTVAVGGTETGGFDWINGNEGVWQFDDCVSHNNEGMGLVVWQNVEKVHTITGFIGYHNDITGIAHGAYLNAYRYERCSVVSNGQDGFRLNALSSNDAVGRGLEITDLYCDAGGRPFGLVVDDDGPVGATLPTLVQGATFVGATKAAVRLVADEPEEFANTLRFVDCTFEGNEFWLDDDVNPDATIEVQDPTHGTMTLRRQSDGSTTKAEWNASVTPSG